MPLLFVLPCPITILPASFTLFLLSLSVPSLPPARLVCLFFPRVMISSGGNNSSGSRPSIASAAQPLISGIVWADSAGQMRRRPMGTRLALLLPRCLALASSSCCGYQQLLGLKPVFHWLINFRDNCVSLGLGRDEHDDGARLSLGVSRRCLRAKQIVPLLSRPFCSPRLSTRVCSVKVRPCPKAPGRRRGGQVIPA